MHMPAAIARLFDAKVRNARRQAKVRIKETRRLLRRAGAGVSDDVRGEVSRQTDELAGALKDGDVASMNKHGEKLGGLLQKHLAAYRKPAWRESFESIAVA